MAIGAQRQQGPWGMRRRAWTIGIICAAAFAVRLGAFFFLDRFQHPDTWESETIALNLLAGKGFVFRFFEADYRSYMEPLYPGLCALVYAVAGHHALALGVVHVLLGTALVWLVYACARRITHEGAALTAAALTALHPGLIVYTTKFHPFILDALLMVAVVAACLMFSPRRFYRSTLIVGGLVGLCTLTRPTIIAALPIIVWWVWSRSTALRHVRLRGIAILLIGMTVVVSPWVLRNVLIHQRLMLTRSGTSIVFWYGNNPYHFTGSLLTPDGEQIVDVVPQAVRDELRTLDELGQQDFFLTQATQYVRAHPFGFLKRWALKGWYFWWFSPQVGLRYPPSWFAVYRGFYLMIIGLTGLGLVASWRDRIAGSASHAGMRFLLGVCLSIGLLQSLYYVEGRHRLAIEPLLLIVAAQGLWSLRSWWMRRRGGLEASW